MQTGHFQANGRLKHEAFANTGQGRHIAQSSIPEDLSVAFKVLCNAARADKTRLQQLEVEVARFSHRAETAESEKLELQAQLQQLQVSYNAARADNTRLQQLEVEVARYSHRADAAESAKLELQAQLQQLQQLQVSYNAARADKARLQQLEVEVARFSRRAETAESEKLELQASLQQLQGAWEQQAEMIDRLKALKSALALKDAELTERLQQQAHHHAQELAQWQHKLKSALSLKDAELTERLQQQSDRHANELAQLQHKLSQTSMELMAVQQQVANLRQQQQHELSSVRQQHTQEMCMLQQQHTQEVSRLQQQLEEAAQKARSTEASSVHVREALSFHTRMGQQLSCLLTLTNNSSSHTHSTSLPTSPLANRSSYGLPASLPASPFAASCPVTPLPPVQYTQPNLRSCSSVEPAASPSSRSALSGFHSGISISATRDSPAHSYEWDSRNGTNTQLSEGQHPHSPAHSSSMPEDRAAASAVVAAAAAAAQPGWHSHAGSSAAAGSSSSLTPMRSTRCVSPRSSPNSPLRSAETPVAEPTVSFTPIRSSGCVSPRSSPLRSMETPTTNTHEAEAAVAAAVAAAQSNWHSHGIRGGAAEGLPSLTHVRSTGCVSPRSNPSSPLRSIETPAAATQASAAAAAVSGDPAQDGSASFKLPLLSREYARLAVSSKAESAAAAAAAAKLASQLYSVSSTRPLVSGEYVPLGGGGTAGPPDEQMTSQLFSGPALMPFSKAAPGQPSHRAAGAVAQRPAAAERQKWKAAAGKTAPQQQQTGLGVRAASGSGRKQWNQQTATAGYAAKVQPAALSGEVKEGAAVGQQQQQQVRQQEHEQQRQILMAAAQLAAQWVEQRGAYSQAAGSVRSGSRHATPAQQARTKYEQLLQKATERVDQQLQKEKQRQLHQQEKKQQKDRGPGMLMFRWSRDSTPRRFSSTGASVDPGPAESHAAPSSGGSSRHASEVAVEPSARVFSPRSSRRVSTASNCSEKQAAGTGQGRNQSRRRADDGTAASAPSYTHFSFKQHKKRTQYQCLRSAQVKQQHQ